MKSFNTQIIGERRRVTPKLDYKLVLMATAWLTSAVERESILCAQWILHVKLVEKRGYEHRGCGWRWGFALWHLRPPSFTKHRCFQSIAVVNRSELNIFFEPPRYLTGSWVSSFFHWLLCQRSEHGGTELRSKRREPRPKSTANGTVVLELQTAWSPYNVCIVPVSVTELEFTTLGHTEDGKVCFSCCIQVDSGDQNCQPDSQRSIDHANHLELPGISVIRMRSGQNRLLSGSLLAIVFRVLEFTATQRRVGIEQINWKVSSVIVMSMMGGPLITLPWRITRRMCSSSLITGGACQAS